MTTNDSNAVRHVLFYLQAAGYRPLPSELWPSGVLGAYANSEGDAVVVLHVYPLGLELRPLERGFADAAQHSSPPAPACCSPDREGRQGFLQDHADYRTA